MNSENDAIVGPSNQALKILEEEIASGKLTLDSFLPFPLALHEMPKGWLSLDEIRILYTLARLVPGPILELGSWLGRSSAAIAQGIKDSEKQKSFDIADFGITSCMEWEEKLKESFQRFSTQDIIVRSIHQPGGSIAVLIDNLRQLNLLPYATSIIRGNWVDVPLRNSYGLLFCDTLHDEREVREYAARLNSLVEPGGWLICDDVIDNRLADILKEYIEFDLWFFSNPLDQYSKFGIGRKSASPRR